MNCDMCGDRVALQKMGNLSVCDGCIDYAFSGYRVPPTKGNDMSAVYKDRLKALRKTWSDNKEGPATIDNGEYNMRLQKAEMRPSETSDKLTIYRSWVVLDGDFKGSQVRDMIGLENEFGPSVMNNWLIVSGLESPSDPTELEKLVEDLGKARPAYVCDVRKSRGSDFINVKTKELLLEEEEEDAGTPEEKEEESLEGQTVSFDDDGKTITGKVVGINEGDDTVDVEVGNDIYTISTEDVEPAEAKKGEDEDQEELRLSLLALVQSACEEEVTEETDVNTLVKIMGGYEWKETELTEDELGVLNTVGVEVTPAPKPTRKVSKKRRRK